MSDRIFGATSGDRGWPGDPAAARPGGLLSLSCGMAATDTVVITVSGELDLASAEHAFGYVRAVIDRHAPRVVLDLAPLSFCDARGLDTLLRMRRYAEQAGCALRLMSPPPRLLRIMRITSLESELMAPGAATRECGLVASAAGAVLALSPPAHHPGGHRQARRGPGR
jgi:anti-sigma B factor antagonist